MNSIEMLSIDNIKTNGGSQMRAELNQDTVEEYAASFKETRQWGNFPPVVVFYDGKDYWLADGFHRVQAWKQAGNALLDARIPADVHSGTRRDAILYAASANATHGLRRTNADKRRAVETLLRDEEWGKWSDREIARRCAVSDVFVGKVRKELSANGLQMSEERTVQRNGVTYTQNNAERRARQQAKKLAQEIKAATWGNRRASISAASTSQETLHVDEEALSNALLHIFTNNVTLTHEQQQAVLREATISGRLEATTLAALRCYIELDADAIEPELLRAAARRAYMHWLQSSNRQNPSAAQNTNDERVNQAQQLVRLYRQAISTAEQYGQLTGKFTDFLAVRRELQKCIDKLQELIDALITHKSEKEATND